MRVFGYRGLESSLDEERCLCGTMRDEEERILVKTYLGVAHGRAIFL